MSKKSQDSLYGKLPHDLADEARSVVAAIRSGELTSRDHARVVDLIARMTDASFKHFFIDPLPELGIGMRTKGLVQVGIVSAVKAIRIGLGRVLPKVDEKHWPRIADFLEQALGKH